MLQGTAEIPSISVRELQEFWHTVTAHESAVGILNEHMKAIQADPLKQDQAGLAEWRTLFDQIKVHSGKIEAAYVHLREDGGVNRC